MDDINTRPLHFPQSAQVSGGGPRDTDNSPRTATDGPARNPVGPRADCPFVFRKKLQHHVVLRHYEWAARQQRNNRVQTMAQMDAFAPQCASKANLIDVEGAPTGGGGKPAVAPSIVSRAEDRANGDRGDVEFRFDQALLIKLAQRVHHFGDGGFGKLRRIGDRAGVI